MRLLITNVTYSYGRHPVLRGVTGELGPGLTVLLGANGSGKTTLLSLIATRLALKGGSIRADGHSWNEPRDLMTIRRLIGWVPQALDIDRAMRVHDFVSYCGWLRGMHRRDAALAAHEVLERVGLSDRSSDRIRSLSGGMQRRALIAAGLVHSPSLLVLDEPTAGLDVQHRDLVITMLHDLGRDGVAVLLSTHISEDAQAADQIAILSKGLLAVQSTPAELSAEYGSVATALLAVVAQDDDGDTRAAWA